MKHPAIRPVHKKKELTTNYAAGTHKEFCKRCFARNGTRYCPINKYGQHVLYDCSL